MKRIWFVVFILAWCAVLAGFTYGAWRLLCPATFSQRCVVIFVAFIAWVGFLALWGSAINRSSSNEDKRT